MSPCKYLCVCFIMSISGIIKKKLKHYLFIMVKRQYLAKMQAHIHVYNSLKNIKNKT